MMQQMFLGLGAASQTYWIAVLTENTTSFSDVVLDSSDNIYISGSTNAIGSGQFDVLVAKYDTDGVIQWQKVSGTGGGDQEQSYSIDRDSGGEIVITGRRFTTSAYSDAIFQLFDSSGGASGGGAQYRVLSGSGNSQEYFTGSARNSSNETYLVGHTQQSSGGANRVLIAKYNNSTNIVYQKVYGGSSEQTRDRGKSLSLDSSDNMYVCGWTSSGPASNNDIFVVKFNSSGVIQWQRGIGRSDSGTMNDYGNGICLDSSNNVYVVGETGAKGGYQEGGLILKYNSSGTIQWNRTMHGSGQIYFYGVCVDSSDNVYACGRWTSGGKLVIVKYNSSGTIQWQRSFDSGAGDSIGYSIQCDSKDNLIIAGTTNSKSVVLKLSNDGSLTGTYGSYVYAATTNVDGTASMTEAALSFGVSNSGLSASTLSNTTSTGTLTPSTTTL
jgi:hypothetical protein